VTIPKVFRRSLGIRAGAEVRFEERAGVLTLLPADGPGGLEALVGIAKGRSTEQALRRLRGPGWKRDLDGSR
jgi:bifunctional DNA-binding transcriptional regulator/antitoxin component of YhaV-PrlF toxin-antitoxin module